MDNNGMKIACVTRNFVFGLSAEKFVYTIYSAWK